MEAQRNAQPSIPVPDKITVEMSELEASLLYTLISQIAGYTGDDPTYQMVSELYYTLRSAGVGRIKGTLTFPVAAKNIVEVRTQYTEESE